MSIGRALAKKLLEKATGKLGDALSQADVLGGKVRDRVGEKLSALNRSVARAPVAPADCAAVAGGAPATGRPAPLGLGDSARAAQIFGRASCPWSGRARALLESARIEHSYFDLDAYGGESVLRELKLETKQDTVPYVYVRGRFIGGYNALDELHRLGQLEYLALPEAERARHPLHGRVEVAPRAHDGERIFGA